MNKHSGAQVGIPTLISDVDEESDSFSSVELVAHRSGEAVLNSNNIKPSQATNLQYDQHIDDEAIEEDMQSDDFIVQDNDPQRLELDDDYSELDSPSKVGTIEACQNIQEESPQKYLQQSPGINSDHSFYHPAFPSLNTSQNQFPQSFNDSQRIQNGESGSKKKVKKAKKSKQKLPRSLKHSSKKAKEAIVLSKGDFIEDPNYDDNQQEMHMDHTSDQVQTIQTVVASSKGNEVINRKHYSSQKVINTVPKSNQDKDNHDLTGVNNVIKIPQKQISHVRPASSKSKAVSGIIRLNSGGIARPIPEREKAKSHQQNQFYNLPITPQKALFCYKESQQRGKIDQYLDESQGLLDSLFDQSSQSTNATVIKKSYAQLLRIQVENKYAGRIHQAKQTCIELAKAQYQTKLKQLEQKKERLKKLLEKTQAKAKLEMLLHQRREQSKVWGVQALDLTRSWLFSAILDSEKCRRFAQINEQTLIQNVQMHKIFFLGQYIRSTIQQLPQMDFVKISVQQNNKKDKNKQQSWQIGQELRKFVLEGAISPKHNNSQVEIELVSSLSRINYEKDKNLEGVSNYKINCEIARMPSLQILLKNSTDIDPISMQSSAFKQRRYKLKKYPNEKQLQRLISTKNLSAFGDPEIQRRDLRLFFCGQDYTSTITSPIQSSRKIGSTMYEPVEGLFRRQQESRGGGLSQSVLQLINGTLRKVNQIGGSDSKLLIDLHGAQSMLCEARLKHLLQSRVFGQFFYLDGLEDNEVDMQQNFIVQHFYVVEEESLFTVPPQFYNSSTSYVKNGGQVPSKLLERKRSRFVRKLRDFEVLFLLFSYLKPLISNSKKQQTVQLVELAFNPTIMSQWTSLLNKNISKTTLSQTIDQDDRTGSGNQDASDNQTSAREQSYHMVLAAAHSQHSYFLVDKYMQFPQDGEVCMNPAASTKSIQAVDRLYQSMSENSSNDALKNATEALQDSMQQRSKLCKWPNCLNCAVTSQTQPQAFSDKMGEQIAVLTNQPSVGQITTKKRPESGKTRITNNASFSHNTYIAQTMTHQNSSDFANKLTKRLTRLGIALDLDVNQSEFSKFIKKLKISSKEKSAAVKQPGIQSNYGHQQAKITPVLQAIGSQQNGFNSQRQEVTQGIQEHYCSYHRNLEQYIQKKQKITLVPTGLSCNNFLKGMSKGFDRWQEELKHSVLADAVVQTVMERNCRPMSRLETLIPKIFNLAQNFSKPVQNSNVYRLQELLQNVPQRVNFIEHFQTWIAHFCSSLQPIQVNNKLFSSLIAQFMISLGPLLQSVKQVAHNESFIITEIAKWITPQAQKTDFLTPGQKVFLGENFNQFMQIIQDRDVIQKFTMFQLFIDQLFSSNEQQPHFQMQGQMQYMAPQARLMSASDQDRRLQMYKGGGTIQQFHQNQQPPLLPSRTNIILQSAKVRHPSVQPNVQDIGITSIGGSANRAKQNNPQSTPTVPSSTKIITGQHTIPGASQTMTGSFSGQPSGNNFDKLAAIYGTFDKKKVQNNSSQNDSNYASASGVQKLNHGGQGQQHTLTAKVVSDPHPQQIQKIRDILSADIRTRKSTPRLQGKPLNQRAQQKTLEHMVDNMPKSQQQISNAKAISDPANFSSSGFAHANSTNSTGSKKKVGETQGPTKPITPLEGQYQLEQLRAGVNSSISGQKIPKLANQSKSEAWPQDSLGKKVVRQLSHTRQVSHQYEQQPLVSASLLSASQEPNPAFMSIDLRASREKESAEADLVPGGLLNSNAKRSQKDKEPIDKRLLETSGELNMEDIKQVSEQQADQNLPDQPFNRYNVTLSGSKQGNGATVVRRRASTAKQPKSDHYKAQSTLANMRQVECKMQGHEQHGYAVSQHALPSTEGNEDVIPRTSTSQMYKQWSRPPIHQNQGIQQQKNQSKLKDLIPTDASAAKEMPIQRSDLSNGQNTGMESLFFRGSPVKHSSRTVTNFHPKRGRTATAQSSELTLAVSRPQTREEGSKPLERLGNKSRMPSAYLQPQTIPGTEKARSSTLVASNSGLPSQQRMGNQSKKPINSALISQNDHRQLLIRSSVLGGQTQSQSLVTTDEKYRQGSFSKRPETSDGIKTCVPLTGPLSAQRSRQRSKQQSLTQAPTHQPQSNTTVDRSDFYKGSLIPSATKNPPISTNVMNSMNNPPAQQLEYNTEILRKTSSGIHAVASRQQRMKDKHNVLVNAYSNAAPRLASAHQAAHNRHQLQLNNSNAGNASAFHGMTNSVKNAGQQNAPSLFLASGEQAKQIPQASLRRRASAGSQHQRRLSSAQGLPNSMRQTQRAWVKPESGHDMNASRGGNKQNFDDC